MKRGNSFCFFILISLCISESLSAQNKSELLLQTSEVNHLMINFDSDRGSLSRFYTVANSPERTTRLIGFYNNYISQLKAINFEQLSQEGKADYILFQRGLLDGLKDLQEAEQEYAQVKNYFPFAPVIYDLEKSRRRGIPVNGEEAARQQINLQQQIISAIKALPKDAGIEQTLSKRASESVTGLQSAIKSYYDFYFGYDPLFTWWVEKPYQKTDSLLKAFASQLKSKTAASVAKR